MTSATRTVNVETLARVEGEGGLKLRVRDGKVLEARLNIYEPPRFFEALLRGRDFREAPDITARICGICPIAYQMSSIAAMEELCGIDVGARIRDLRRLVYCGEWIESHALHIYLLHAPDFLGYDDVLGMARDHPQVVERALKLKKIGNDLMIAIGGREIHPVNVKVGGFYRAPARSELRPFADRLRWAIDAARDTVRFAAGLEYPDFEPDYVFVALRHPELYAIESGRIVSNRGLDIEAAEFERHFVEEHVPHSNALHSTLRDGSPYLVGPLARYALNHDRLTPQAAEAAREAGLGPVCRNPFKSLLVRAVELVLACEEALRLVEAYVPPEPPAAEIGPHAGHGHGCTEAPRGILYHRYTLDALGTIRDARIVPPTAQNLRRMEADLREFAPTVLGLPDPDLTWKCEQAVRNYDPCISCATHFLKVTVERDQDETP